MSIHRRAIGSQPRFRSAAITGTLVGVGVAGFVDESIFHQLLQWHNFYWATTQAGRVFSDGLFHVVSTTVLLCGLVRVWQERKSWTSAHSGVAVGGILAGAGSFNAYDGIVQHVILHLHLVDEHVCPVLNADNTIFTCPADVPYEVLWIVGAAIVLVIGVGVARRASSRTQGAQKEQR